MCLLIPKPKSVFVNKKQNESKTIIYDILKNHFRSASCYAYVKKLLDIKSKVQMMTSPMLAVHKAALENTV